MHQGQASARFVDSQRILDVAIGLAADQGFRSLTLRELAHAVGKSTTVIINLFGSKSGLVQAVGEAALQKDADFHACFFESVGGLAPGRDTLVALILSYLRLRARSDAGFVRIWEALLLDPEPEDARCDLMRRWEVMRLQAWRGYLSQSPRLAEFAAPLATCLVIEQFYAGALIGRADYEVIVAEGLGALVDRALNLAEDPASATLWYRENLVLPRAPADGLEPDSMRLKLLDIAADQILTHGVAAVTNRSVSTVAGTSTSTIAYHWPDMRRFLVDAVWHSVFRDMPRHLDRRRAHDGEPPADIGAWARLVAPTVSTRADAVGFYVRYARLIASICLEARRDPAFKDLAMILRGPEGGGTYNNRVDVWPADFDLTRLAATRFALWIKGLALVAFATGSPVTEAELEDGATTLVARRS